MPTPPRFDAATMEMLGRVREVRLETTSADGSRTHRTTIWIVTAGDHAFIRSVRGAGARWYREARHHPEVVLHAEGVSVRVTAVVAADPDTVELVSEALTAKYGPRSAASTASMLLPHTLETTIRLDPREPGT